jgi:hypothetical protein
MSRVTLHGRNPLDDSQANKVTERAAHLQRKERPQRRLKPHRAGHCGGETLTLHRCGCCRSRRHHIDERRFQKAGQGRENGEAAIKHDTEMKTINMTLG